MVSETIEITPKDIFGLIALSGDAKASYHHAMLLMQEGKAEEAAEAVKAGDATLKESHAIQTKFVTLEAQGKTATIGVLMVHAQDQLMNTILVKEMLGYMMNMQNEINQLKGMDQK